jgi:opacity protein-like surface antigen
MRFTVSGRLQPAEKTMKKLILTLAAVMLLAGVSAAQTGIGLNAYIGGSVAVPMNDLNKFWNTGYQGMVGVGFNLTAGLEGVARFAYNSFPDDPQAVIKDANDSSFANMTQDFLIREYSLDIRANLGAPEFRMRPYALIGVGLAKLNSDDKFFYSIGAGFKVTAMPRLNFFLEERYTLISFDTYDVGFIPVTLGLNLSL